VATPSKGIRVTRKRAEELQTAIDRLEGRLDELARRVELSETLEARVLRARLAAEIRVLRDHEATP
jgi:hypothetical protein